MSDDITALSATEMAAAIREKRLSAQDVTTAHLARIEEINPTLNSVCTMNPAALDAAAAVDRRIASGEQPRPLDGVPYLAKDNSRAAAWHCALSP